MRDQKFELFAQIISFEWYIAILFFSSKSAQNSCLWKKLMEILLLLPISAQYTHNNFFYFVCDYCNWGSTLPSYYHVLGTRMYKCKCVLCRCRTFIHWILKILKFKLQFTFPPKKRVETRIDIVLILGTNMVFKTLDVAKVSWIEKGNIFSYTFEDNHWFFNKRMYCKLWELLV